MNNVQFENIKEYQQKVWWKENGRFQREYSSDIQGGDFEDCGGDGEGGKERADQYEGDCRGMWDRGGFPL